MIAAVIAAYLDSLGLVDYDPAGITGDTFIDVVPAEPSECIVLTEYPGPQPEAPHPYDTPNLQVRARSPGRDPRPARARLAAIYNALHNLHGVEIGGLPIVYCYALQSGAAPLGPDQNGRPEYTQNYQFHIRNVTAHRS